MKNEELKDQQGLSGLVASAFLAVLTFFWFGWLSQFGWDPHHDGIITKPAIDVANGGQVFVDTFSQYGAVMIWLQAGVVRLFGESLLAIRLSSVAFLSIAVFFLNLSLMRVVPRTIALVAVLAWLVMNDAHTHVTLAWSSVYLMGIQGVILFLVVLCFQARAERLVFWLVIGALVGLMFFIRMPQGLAHMLAFTLSLTLSPLVRPDHFRFRPNMYALLALFAGLGGVFALVIWVIIRMGAYNDFVLQMFEMARVFPRMIALAWDGQEYNTANFLYSAFNALFPRNYDMIWLGLALGTVLAFLWLVAPQRWIKPHRDWPALLAFTTVAVASWSQYFPIAEPRHFYWASMPMMGPFIVVLMHLMQRWITARFATIGTFAVLALFLANTVPKRAGIVYNRVTSHTAPIEHQPRLLRGLYFPPDKHAELTELAGTLETLRQRMPDRPVVVTGYEPIYVNFVDWTPNWHPVYVSYDIALAVYPSYQRDLADYIANDAPILVTNGEIPLHLGYRPAITTFAGVTVAEPDNDPAQALAQHSFFGPPSTSLKLERDLLFAQAEWVSPIENPPAFRTAPLDLDQDFLLEVALQTGFGMREYETILFSLFGQDQGRGLTVAGGKQPDTLNVTFFGDTETTLVSLILSPRSNYHLAIQRIGSEIQVWLNGAKVGHVRAPIGMGSQMNPFVIGNSIRLQDLFYGKIYAVRAQAGSSTMQDIIASHAHVQRMFDGLGSRRIASTEEENR